MEVIPDILENFFDSLNVSINIDSKIEENGNTKLFTECTKFALCGGKVIINSIEYKIIDLSFNEYIIIKGTFAEVAPLEVKLVNPYHWHGTLQSTNTELSHIPNAWDKYPLIYLYEPIIEQQDDTRDDIRINATIFLLNPNNEQTLSTDCEYDKIIKPLTYLERCIQEKSRKNKFVKEFKNIKRVARIKIGTNATSGGRQKGYKSNIFNDNLTGIEINVDFIVKSCGNCYICKK